MTSNLLSPSHFPTENAKVTANMSYFFPTVDFTIKLRNIGFVHLFLTFCRLPRNYNLIHNTFAIEKLNLMHDVQVFFYKSNVDIYTEATHDC